MRAWRAAERIGVRADIRLVRDVAGVIIRERLIQAGVAAAVGGGEQPVEVVVAVAPGFRRVGRVADPADAAGGGARVAELPQRAAAVGVRQPVQPAALVVVDERRRDAVGVERGQIRRQHSVEKVIGALLKAKITAKQARSMNLGRRYWRKTDKNGSGLCFRKVWKYLHPQIDLKGC